LETWKKYINRNDKPSGWGWNLVKWEYADPGLVVLLRLVDDRDSLVAVMESELKGYEP
jgi:hypothetical protein